jgi:hypothetical protein
MLYSSGSVEVGRPYLASNSQQTFWPEPEEACSANRHRDVNEPLANATIANAIIENIG